VVLSDVVVEAVVAVLSEVEVAVVAEVLVVAVVVVAGVDVTPIVVFVITDAGAMKPIGAEEKKQSWLALDLDSLFNLS
jgi:hypothetical protein